MSEAKEITEVEVEGGVIKVGETKPVPRILRCCKDKYHELERYSLIN